MLGILIKIGISYMLGSVVGSLLLARLPRFRGPDIREFGSGNPGGTNALRLHGPWFAAGVMLIDVGKGILAAGPVAAMPVLGGPAVLEPEAVAVMCGAAAVVGHVWPLWHGFRGGKGAATLLGVMLVVQPWALLAVLAVFAVVLGLWGFVSLATITATSSTIAWAALMVPGGVMSPFGAFAVAMTLFIIYTHRSNIRCIFAGTEYCFERALIFRRRKRPD